MKRFTMLLAFLAFVFSAIQAQNVQITGLVTSAEDGSALPGVSVVVKGTTIGTVTNSAGEYSLSVPEDATTLVFSFVGMQTTEVPIENRTTIDMSLESDVLGLDEVVVVAYGTSTRESLTGAASIVDADQIENRQVSNITNALSGVTPGIQVASDNGQPGTSANIRIRGVGSMSASSAPLYVVDGVPYGEDISAINSQDIESITVLKDATSAALYGARGANGVILINTKEGRSGKMDIVLDVRRGINQRGVPEYDIMTDPGMYYEKYYEGIYRNQLNSGSTPEEAHAAANNLMFGDQGLEYNIYDVPDGEFLIGQNGKVNPNASLGRVWADDYYLTNDNWYDELFGENQTREEYNLQISGGNERQTTFLSVNYLLDEGIISNSAFKRYSARLKSDYQLKEWLKVGGNLSYSNNENRFPSDQEGLSSKNLFFVSRIVAPIYPLYVRDANGDIIVDDLGHTLYDYGTGEYPGLTRPVMSIANPASDLELDLQRYNSDILTMRGFTEVDILKDLKFTFNAAYTINNEKYLDKGNAYYGQSANFGGNIYKEDNRYSALTLQQLLRYNKIFGNNNIELLLGHETYDRQWTEKYGIKYNLYDPESEELSSGILRQETGSQSNGYFVEGYFSRLQYNYSQKYYLTASYRRDGSSRFHPDHRWGDFWSFGGSWLLNKEAFLSNVDWVDFLKFKVSYGAQGNDALAVRGVQNYQPYLDQYDVYNSNDQFGTTWTYAGKKDITWETSYNFNTGFDFNLLNNLFDGSVEFFSRKVEDMLYYIPVPPSAGFPDSQYPDNIGSMRNQGVEFNLTSNFIRTDDVDVSFYVNGTHFTNEILTLPEFMMKDEEGYVTGRRILRVGGSVYDHWYPIYVGVNPETGAPQWRTTNPDGSYGTTESYSEASQKANSGSPGSSLPDLAGGFGLLIEAFGFDLSASFTYGIGGLTYDYIYQNVMHGGQASEAGSNWHKDILDSWTPQNTDTDVPAVNFGGTDIGRTSSRFLVDSDYLSFNNITLGYTIPASVLNQIRLNSARVYATAENVALFTKRMGLDPRQNFDGDTEFIYSPIRRISLGAKIYF